MCEILPYIDFEKIRNSEPKWFLGYSDNTNLIFLLATLCDTAAIYGPCAAAFGMEPWHDSLKDAMGILKGNIKSVHNYEQWEKEGLKTEDNPLEPYNVTEKFQLRTWTAEKGLSIPDDISKKTDEIIQMEGRLLGGCLDCLSILCGTKFDQVEQFNEKYKEDGILWFLESCDLNPMGIRRALWQLDEAGWLKYTKGFLIGRPYCYVEDFFGMDQYTAVLGILSKYNVPVIMDVYIGHLPPMMPLVCGSKAKVKVEGNSIKIDMAYI